MLLWPFILITLGIVCFIAYKYVNMERSIIMNNWKEQRCDVFVMFAAYFLKPEMDTRTDSEFASDNFQFCMKSLVTRAMELAMSPLQLLFKAQAVAADGVTGSMNAMREVLNTLMKAFMSFITPFLRRFNFISYQLSIVTQHLKMAFQRANAALLSFVYIGLSMITGLQNMIQFVMKVVIIILIIMVVLIILLFFILFPFIPIILSVITAIAIIATSSIAGANSQQQADDAEGTRSAFCFAPDIPVVLGNGSTKPISEIRIGDVLEGGSTVEGVLTFDGTQTPLYSLDGIRVSGSHLVQGVEGDWHSVAEDERAAPLSERSPLLYCLNTSNQTIPIRTATGATLLFRDWEEISSADMEGQDMWDILVSKILGGLKSDSQADETFCLMDPQMRVLTANGAQSLESIRIGQALELSYNRPTKVIGTVEGRIQGTGPSGWMSACIEKIYEPTGRYHKRVTTITPSAQYLIGRHLITDSGLFLVTHESRVRRMRDFTEVGMDRIHETYPLVASRLALQK
jgi:hypothetical protein